jgi:peptide/nickel transport system permease protein
MNRYALRRLIVLIPTLLGISIIVFTVMRLIPGDTITAMVGTQFRLSPEQAAALRAYYGFDKPLPRQYVDWLLSALHGDFGYSIRAARPVLLVILGHFPLTLELSVFSMAIAITLGVPLGVLAAMKRDSAIDAAIRTYAMMGLAMPSFWLGMIIILVLSRHLGVLPNAGNYVDFTVDPLSNLRQMVFPALTLGFGCTADLIRMVRSSVIEELGQDYVRTARGKGLAEQAVMLKHCLRNALIPIITIIGLETGYLLGGAVLVESVYTLPGIGFILLNAIFQRDYALIQGSVLFIAVCFALVNLVTDLLYAWADPRIRLE